LQPTPDIRIFRASVRFWHGARLVYSSGILVLAGVAALIVVIFDANEIAMLPLYALGVMLCFTLSQFGMVRLMGRIGRLQPGEAAKTDVTTIHYESGWRWKQAVNFIGGITTGIVFVILVLTKFLEGAWIVAVAIPGLVWMFYIVHRHYQRVSHALSTRELQEVDLEEVADVVIVPIADIHRGTLQALQYAKRISKDVRAVSVVTSQEMHDRVERRWKRFPNLTEGITLVLLDYDFRDILTPIVQYIEDVNNLEFPNQLTTIVIPAFVPETYLARFLHNQTANILRERLHGQKDVIIIDVPYHIPKSVDPAWKHVFKP
jgi:hypothetical protein